MAVGEVVEKGLKQGVNNYNEYEHEENGLDCDFLGRLATWNIYYELLKSGASAEEVFGYYWKTVENIAAIFELDWGGMTNRGSVEKYLADAKQELRKIMGERRLARDWTSRLATFDLIACKLPLLIKYAFQRINSGKLAGSDVYFEGNKERGKIRLISSHVELFGLTGQTLEAVNVAGKLVVWPGVLGGESPQITVEKIVPELMVRAQRVGMENGRVKSGLEKLDAIILVDGDWCYAMNSMDVGGGSFVVLGVGPAGLGGGQAIDLYTGPFCHELDHLDYMAARVVNGVQTNILSGLLMEYRGQKTLEDVAIALDMGMSVDDIEDIARYEFLLTATRGELVADIRDGGLQVKPNEIIYPAGKFGNGNWRDWAAIFEALTVALPIGKRSINGKTDGVARA